MPLRPGELLIDDDFKDADLVFKPVIDGEPKARGAVPRDYRVQPRERFAPPGEIKVLSDAELSDRIKELDREQAALSHVLLRGDRGAPIPSLDQNGQGYCWAYSTGGCILALRAAANMPYVRVSPHAVAWKIKRGRDEGGWGALSCEFAHDQGYPSDEFWPQKSMSGRNDNPETWANAKLHRVTEDWADLGRDVYDRSLTFRQVLTLLVTGTPVVLDFNWWGHSVFGCDAVEVEPGSFGVRIRNSWSDGWGDRGFSVLRGSKAVPDGAVAPRVTTASNT